MIFPLVEAFETEILKNLRRLLGGGFYHLHYFSDQH